MNVRVTKLGKAETALVGKSIPKMEYHNQNNVATLVEETMKDEGYHVDSCGTVDLPGLDVEIKSRSIQSRSPQTVGSMTVRNIINTPYNLSSIKKKIKQQFRVKHDQVNCVIVDAKMYHFDDFYIQGKLEEAYEYGRAIIASMDPDKLPAYIPPNGHIAYFERCTNRLSYSFRIRNGAMKKLEKMSATSKTFQACFEAA